MSSEFHDASQDGPREPIERSSEHDAQPKQQLNRRQLLQRGGILGVVASLLSISPFAPTWRKESAAASPATQASAVHLEQLEALQAKPFIVAALATAAYAQFKQEVTTTYHDTFVLQEEAAVAILATTTSGQPSQLVSVHVPVSGGKGYSVFTAVLSYPSPTVLGTQSMLFLHAGADVHAICCSNGTIILDAVVSVNGRFLSGLYTTADGKALNLAKAGSSKVIEASRSGFWNCMNDCLGQFNVPAWLLVIAAGVCAAACFVTAGLGCILCIAGVIGIASGVVGYCAGYCG